MPMIPAETIIMQEREAADRAAARSAWLPIDTAPKDGASVWVSDGFHMRIAFWESGRKYEYRGSVGGGWRDLFLLEATRRGDLQFTPTLWQALPSPPNLSSLQQG